MATNEPTRLALDHELQAVRIGVGMTDNHPSAPHTRSLEDALLPLTPTHRLSNHEERTRSEALSLLDLFRFPFPHIPLLFTIHLI